MEKLTNQDLMAQFVSAKGVILTKKLFKFLHGDKAQGKELAGLKPVAQSPGLYGAGYEPGQLTDQVMAFFRKNTTEPEYVKAVIELLFLYGIRISEALAVSYTDISPAGVIYVKGQKGSNDRFVRPVSYAHFWAFVRDTKVSYTGIYSRFYIYRVLRKYGFASFYGDNVNMSVSHMFRHEFARDLMGRFGDIEKVQKGLGQKSKKSAEFYVKGIRKQK